MAKTAGVRGKTRTAYFDDVSLEGTTTLACFICSVKVYKSVNRKLRSSMRKEHVSESTVKTAAWGSASSWQTSVRTASLGINCFVTDSLVVMTTDHKEVTYSSVSQAVVRGPQVVLGFCPCGPFRLNISPKKTEKIKLT